MSKPTALVTGGAGFIGSHCCVDLLKNGYDVVVVDNLVNSSKASLEGVRRLEDGAMRFYQLDLADTGALEYVFASCPIEVVIHFAAHKAVGDSMDRPLEYYSNNVTGLLSLLAAMRKASVQHLIFSSSCSIYGNTEWQEYRELDPAQLSTLVTTPHILDKRNCLDFERWRSFGWTYRAMGRPVL